MGSVLLWGATGPVFHYSETWQLVINTGTTIVTFLMVLLIQNTRRRISSGAVTPSLSVSAHITRPAPMSNGLWMPRSSNPSATTGSAINRQPSVRFATAQRRPPFTRLKTCLGT
ncbi:low affinity iron permease family protein [Mesorhizobium sp. B3-2-1]|nr:low affinity iron permease family protein [Mesorhizobium sp. B3-2-1]